MLQEVDPDGDGSDGEAEHPDEEDAPFANVGNRCSNKYAKQIQTAVNRYDEFLTALHEANPQKYPHTSLETTPNDALLHYRDIFGMFPDYLRKVRKVGYGSTCGYVSKIKTLICDTRNTISDIAQGSWYSKLNVNIRKDFNEQAVATGTSLTKSAPPMTARDLNCLSSMLTKKNTRDSLSHRCLLVWQWQALGRISEIAAMNLDDIAWNHNFSCLRITMNRTKVGKEQDINLFKHASSWQLCPIHALGTVLVMASPNDRLFPLAPATGASSYVNKILKELIELYAEPDAEGPAEGPAKRKRNRGLTSLFEGLYSRLNKVALYHPHYFPSPHNVVDNATTQARRFSVLSAGSEA